MKTEIVKRKIKGIEFSVPTASFETIDEAVSSAGSVERLVSLINLAFAPSAKKQIVKAIREQTEVPFLVAKKKDKRSGTIKEVRDTKKDSDDAYIVRAMKASGAKAEELEIPTLFVSLADRRKEKSKKIPKRFLKLAASFLSGEKSLDRLNSAFSTVGIGAFAPSGNSEADTLALAVLCADYESKTRI